MGEAWILDAVRTPRAKGKPDTGALSTGVDGNKAHLVEMHPLAPQGISADPFATIERG